MPPPRTAQDWAREARELAGAWAAFFLLPFHGVLTLAVARRDSAQSTQSTFSRLDAPLLSAAMPGFSFPA